MRCCKMFSSRPRILRSSIRPSGLNTTDLSMRFMNSGVNFLRAASNPAREILSVIPLPSHSPAAAVLLVHANPDSDRRDRLISAAPRLLVMKIMARPKSTLRLSPSVSVALSRMPSSRFHSASLAFSISSKSIKLSFTFSV